MKLSEIKGERAIDVIADLIAPIAGIASNRDKMKLESVEPIEGEEPRDTAIRNLKVQIPVILRENKSELIEIIGIITGEDASEMTLPTIMKETVDLLNDKDFAELFLSVAPMVAKRPRTVSSEHAEATEPEQ